jgi:hypothetical protein
MFFDYIFPIIFNTICLYFIIFDACEIKYVNYAIRIFLVCPLFYSITNNSWICIIVTALILLYLLIKRIEY